MEAFEGASGILGMIIADASVIAISRAMRDMIDIARHL